MPAPALVRVFKDAKGQDQASYRKALDANGLVSYTGSERWKVIYDGIVNQNVAATATGLPRVGSNLGSVDGNPVIVAGVTPTRSSESPYVWDVLIDFASKSPPTSHSNNWSINLSKSSTSWEQIAYQDRLGKSSVNTAGDLLPQLPPEKHFDGTISITWTTKNAPTDHEADIGKVNSDAISIVVCGITLAYGIRQMRLVGAPIQSTRNVSGVDAFGHPINTYQYNCELQYETRKDGFGPWKAPNEGYRGYPDDDPDPGTIPSIFRDQHGTPQSAPTKMDASSVPLAPTDEIVYCPACLSDAGAGRFEIELQTAFTAHFTGLKDSDQIPFGGP